MSTLKACASIYDASIDPTLWTSSLLRISDTLGGTTAGIGLVDAEGRGDIISIRCEPDALDSFIAYYAERNPMLRHLPTVELGKPFTDRELMPRSEWQRTEFYSDWGRITDNHSCLLMPVLRSNGQHGWFAVGRSADAGNFEQRHIELAALLGPHLRRALEIGKRLNAARVSAAPVLEQINIAALCIDRAGHIIWNNARAEALIDSNDGLRKTSNNILATVSYSASGDLQRLLQRAGSGLGGMLRLERQSGLSALIVIAVPLRDRAPNHSAIASGTAASTTLFVVDSASRPAGAEERIALEGLRALYGLTVMEARVALQLARGTGIPYAASALGVAPSTIRSHAKRLYRKMDIHSQADLAALIERICLFGDA